MNPRVEKWVARLKDFNQEIQSFVESCSEDDWRRHCEWEDWSVGVTARHIGAGHFQAVSLVKMIVDGQKIPELTIEQVVGMANAHAKEHAGCSRTEVLEILRRSGAAMVEFVSGLSENDLDRTGNLALTGGEISAEKLLKALILKSGGEHLAHMKSAVGRSAG